MISTDLDGPRLAELFIAELVGRNLGPLGSIDVEGVDHPAVSIDGGERYLVTIDGDSLAAVRVAESAVHVERLPAGPTVRIEDGTAVKRGVDVLAEWVG